MQDHTISYFEGVKGAAFSHFHLLYSEEGGVDEGKLESYLEVIPKKFSRRMNAERLNPVTRKKIKKKVV